MRSTVSFSLGSGELIELEPGDLIGRASGCVLRIPDRRISEAHAMVSRRREGLALVALRGRITRDGKPKSRVALEVGTRVVLSGFFPLVVSAMSVSMTRLGVLDERARGDDERPVPLGRVVSLHADRPPIAYFDPDGLAHILGGRKGPRLRQPAEPDIPLQVGETFAVGDRTYRLVETRLAVESQSTIEPGQFEDALRIVAKFDVVQISSDSGRGLSLDGIAARLVSELAEIRAPVAWAELARVLWNAPADAATRHRWDQLLVRIRSKLRAAGIRGDLIRSNGSGLVELALGPGDKVKLVT
jgi:hypothetical protein